MPRPIRYLLILLGGWVVASELHGLGLGWVPVGPEKWLHLVVMGAGAALCILRAVLRREERAAWLLLGLGVMAWVLGELYFTAVLWTDASPPVPSPADAGYLSLPPLVFAGLVVLARSRIRGLSKTLWADGLTAGLTAGAISAAVVFKPVVNALGGGQLAIATNLSYPVADLLLLGLICGLLAAGGRRLDRRFAILALGIALFWASDTVYLIKTAQGTWVSGGPFDPGWWAISVCFATAAWTKPKGRAASIRPRPVISIPIVFALVSLAILVVGNSTKITLPAVLLAAGALLSVLGRLALTFREHQAMLDRSRTEASTDPLTGLGNRRALAATLAARLESPQLAPMVLALFDLDGFKSYNDRFGHVAGDALLQRLATGLGVVLASPASVYRVGGDEFCALLPGGDEGRALLSAASAVLTESGDGFSISASAGSVALPEETDDVGEALRLADQRMYAHKDGVRRAAAADEVKRALLSALAQRDPRLSDHVTDVADLAEHTARELGCTPAMIEKVRIAAELHDVGKMAIPEALLDKTGALTDQEWALMRQHTVAGERIIGAAAALADVAPLVRSSHEHWDGGGYPDGLTGEQIPAGAQIVSVCDSYHAMTSDRSYRQAMSADVAIAELRAGSGTQFSPAVVSAFLRVHARGVTADPPRFAEFALRPPEGD
ncbi:MAG: diguanylate cyclase [Actinomycetota bacterium]|nr:diguanylate cyclase [Actinomycetota bacterium]